MSIPDLYKIWTRPLVLAFGREGADDLFAAMRPTIEYARAAQAVGVIASDMQPALVIDEAMAAECRCGLAIVYRFPGEANLAPRRWYVPDFHLDQPHDQTDRTPPWATEEAPAPG